MVDIAYALDIKGIEAQAYPGCEGLLYTSPNKAKGVIGVHSASGRARRRFTIAHELGHFIHPSHKPLTKSGTSDEGSFMCSAQDLSAKPSNGKSSLTSYQKQELQANQFAAELLMPAYKMRPYINRGPNLERVLEIASTLKVSREAAANRYVAMHDDCIAIVFSHNRIVRYISITSSFPRTLLWNGDALPMEAHRTPEGCSDIDDADSDVWLSPNAGDLSLQILPQANGYQMSLLTLALDAEEDMGVERSDERFKRF